MGITKLQQETLDLWYKHNESYAEVARIVGKNESSVRKLVRKAKAWLSASSGQIEALKATGLDVDRAKHGWRIVVDPITGSRDSVFWTKEPDEEEVTLSLADAIKDSLKTVLPAKPIKKPTRDLSSELCNFIPLADLHIGGEYGDPNYLDVVFNAIEDLTTDLPKAKKAVLIDMGDLLDANDHHGLTPASGNNCDVIRENHLKNTVDAIAIMRLAITRLAESHEEVEVHLIRGNHDETSYIGVMVALHYYFKDNPRINVVVSDDNFRVISWGKCAVFPHHGDKAKWEDLKSVFSDQFPDEWSSAKYWRFIWTAHFHHDKQKEMIGAVGEHFRTLSKPNQWAMLKGFFTRGGIQCVTLHKEFGEVNRTKVNLKPLLLQDVKPDKSLI